MKSSPEREVLLEEKKEKKEEEEEMDRMLPETLLGCSGYSAYNDFFKEQKRPV